MPHTTILLDLLSLGFVDIIFTSFREDGYSSVVFKIGTNRLVYEGVSNSPIRISF